MAFIPPPKHCPLCPRLMAFRDTNTQAFPQFYNGAVPSFGGLDAQLLVVGLAPGLKGANATGRPFTGDYAGVVLYEALAKHGFARGNYQARADDGFHLLNVRITNAVRCVPPENKPTPEETKTCNRFLAHEIAAMENLKIILSLGTTSHGAVLRALKLKAKDYPFGHGAVHSLVASNPPVRHSLCEGGSPGVSKEGKTAEHAPRTTRHAPLLLLNSYHTSRYNISTGRLTQAMFDAVVVRAEKIIAPYM